jgi:hypothetical protein
MQKVSTTLHMPLAQIIMQKGPAAFLFFIEVGRVQQLGAEAPFGETMGLSTLAGQIAPAQAFILLPGSTFS